MAVQFDLEWIIKTACDLISIPSRNPPGEEKVCAEYIYNKLKEIGIESYMVNAPLPNRPQVVGILRGRKAHPALILNGHIDVVPEGNLSLWKTLPFDGTVKDGKIFGRGACDMKTALAMMLEVARTLKNRNIEGTIIFTFASGEERLEPGTKYLLTEFLPCHGINGDFGIVLEPTQCNIGVAEGGGIWTRVVVKGRASHSSTPEKGINAISKAAKLISRIDEYNLSLMKSKSHPLVKGPSLKVTMINGGVKENIIPETCNLLVERRVLPTESLFEARKELEWLLDEMSRKDFEFKYEVEETTSWEPAEVGKDSFIVEQLINAYKLVLGREPKIVGVPYGTDMRNFVNDANIPCVIFGPGNIENAHSPNEFISVKEIDISMKVILSLLENLL
ncbi:MAG: ArgE/DapE family deacylase [Candidatus Methanomethyliaceae archaeon]